MKKDEVHNVVVHNVVNLKSAMLLRSLPPPKKKECTTKNENLGLFGRLKKIEYLCIR